MKTLLTLTLLLATTLAVAEENLIRIELLKAEEPADLVEMDFS